MSLRVSSGISCGNRRRRETYRKPERKKQTTVGEGEFKSGAGTVGGTEGRRKVALTFSPFPLFRGKSRMKSRRKTGQRGQKPTHPLWITFALELFAGRFSLWINVVVNL